jgi:hypothetical protein
MEKGRLKPLSREACRERFLVAEVGFCLLTPEGHSLDH